MPSLIYTPEVKIHIRTAPDSPGKGKVIDVSEDVVSGNLVRVIRGVSTTEFTILNQGRKYDGLFSPMDTVSIRLRRIRQVLKFTGYLDAVPLWQALPGSITLRGSCSLKRLQYWYWDPTSPAGATLLDLESYQNQNASSQNDGGLAARTVDVLSKVAYWPQSQIHIARIPDSWVSQVTSLANQMISEAEAMRASTTLGAGPTMGGSYSMAGSSATVPSTIQGTGTIPATSGKISEFGGPGGGAYGNMALTGESGTNPTDPWYCAMRWPYTEPGAGAGAKQWWTNRRIMVSNPQTGKAVVLRAADWGPAQFTGRVIDVSPTALRDLGAVTDSTVHIGFAPAGAPLGPVRGSITLSQSAQAVGGQLVTSGASGGTGASPIFSGWGRSGDPSNEVWVSAQGCRFQVNRICAKNFVGFVNDLANILGYHPKEIGGFRASGGGGGPENHGYGAAIDIDWNKNPWSPNNVPMPYALPKPPALINLARKWGLGWGGEYQNSKDYMHFEVIGAPYSNVAAYSAHPHGYGPAPTGSSGAGGTSMITRWQPPIHGNYTLGPRFGETGPYWANGHSGTDFQAPTGTPIYPVGPGTVHLKGYSGSDYGNYISIDHGGGVYTFYAHMLNPSPLSVGDPVTTNTSLGQVDTTGNATGPHVHVELRKGADTYTAALASGGIDKYVLGPESGRAAPPAGVTLNDSGGWTGTGPGGTTDTGLGTQSDVAVGQGLLNVYLYQAYLPTQEGKLLSGSRALMNDVPVFTTIDELMQTGMRDYCSAPNGDFIGWFPDYFGHYKQAGKMIITPLEIDGTNGPPTIGWDDTNLKTHQFVSGASQPEAGDASLITQMITTAGVASVEFPEILKALLNISDAEAKSLGTTYLKRFGARPDFVPLNQISGARQEFFFACMLFMQNWSQQFQAQVNLSFMPELYPGMLACFPEYGIQGYIQRTTDSWDLNGAGFSTSISAFPWSSIGSQKTAANQRLPKGAPL